MMAELLVISVQVCYRQARKVMDVSKKLQAACEKLQQENDQLRQGGQRSRAIMPMTHQNGMMHPSMQRPNQVVSSNLKQGCAVIVGQVFVSKLAMPTKQLVHKGTVNIIPAKALLLRSSSGGFRWHAMTSLNASSRLEFALILSNRNLPERWFSGYNDAAEADLPWPEA